MKHLVVGFLIATSLLTSSCSGDKEVIKNDSKTQKEEKMELSNKEKALEVLKSIETGDQSAIAHINAEKYIQHNLGVADGLEGFGAVLAQLPPNSAKVNTVRAFQDGDFVFTQTDYNFFGPKIGFDIFRFEDGKIVEHWDNLAEKPEGPNPSGRTMIDGTIDISDLDKTAENKTLAANFVDDVLVNGRMDQLTNYFDGDNYLQHNAQVGDGLSGLGEAMKAMAAQGVEMKYTKVHRVLGEGNFVLTVSEGSFGGAHTSFYDLFRMENGKIAEHWDVIETIAPEDQHQHNNGKF